MDNVPPGFGFFRDGIPLLWQDRAQIENTSRNNINPELYIDNLFLINVLNKYKLFVDNLDESVGKNLINDGYWEIWITQFLSRQIQPGWTVIDVGANFGYYTMVFADFVGEEGKVFAIEPNTYLQYLLSASIKENNFSNIDLLHLAVSNFQGLAKLSFDMNRLGDGSVVYEAGKLTTDTNVSTLDILFSGKKIDLIKIDVEGAEPEVLYGAENIILNNQDIRICCEWVPSRYKEPSKILDYIERLGLRMFTISESGTIVYEISRDEILGKDWDMLYLVRDID